MSFRRLSIKATMRLTFLDNTIWYEEGNRCLFTDSFQLRDSPNDFAKIACFEPVINVIRRHGTSYRRICIKGHDGSTWRFVVQNPSARQSRREERMMQLLQVMDK